ncbi:Urea transporter 1 [Orchesella cincta]|uniref:Urea transporter 1 n=1 Tax=Orchesella cincta TaxID=48709 RepID=A0A1D2N6S8_ORCCI|nr:Urea transporter 1 [Orchesella cincta]
MAQPSNRRLEQDNGDKLDEDLGQWHFCFGHSPAVDIYLKAKNGKAWLVPKFLNALFRGIGQATFANNPFSGILIFTGIVWHSLMLGWIQLLAGTTAIITALLINVNPALITSGSISFNSILLATVTTSICDSNPLFGVPVGSKFLMFIIVGSSLSVFITDALSNISNSFKPSIPILSIPFHILAVIIMTGLRITVSEITEEENSDSRHALVAATNQLDGSVFNETTSLPKTEDWITEYIDLNPSFYSYETLQNSLMAVILSGGQVFGINDLFSSLLVYAGLMMYSPILTFMCLLGATTATLFGLFISPFPNVTVFDGIWGFNGLLSCGAIGLFYVFRFQSVIHGIASVCFTAFLQLSLSNSFQQTKVPVLAFPFLISTIIFVCGLTYGQKLVRVPKITFPELHKKLFKRQRLRDEELGVQQGLMNG